MPNRNNAPFELKEWKLGFEETDYYGPFSRKTSYRQGPNRCKRHHYCLLKARGVRGGNTKEKVHEIAVFTRVSEDFKFVRDGQDFKNKVPIGEYKIIIACMGP